MSSRPATSCHLTYPLPAEKINSASSWSLQATVRVEESTDCTYFCVVGWAPGGYSGIQEIDNNRKVAIFSMWNEGRNNVELVSAGQGAKVTEFGGEGTGLKCMKEFKWDKEVPVTFVVTGVLEDSATNTWMCYCEYIYKGERNFMAAYRRSGGNEKPLHSGGFYSFVEDWDRCEGAEGHCIQRSAYFSNQKATLDGHSVDLSRIANFSKVENGHDLFGAEKATGGCNGSEFFLCTGGVCDRKAVANGTVLRK
eukprot:TRINITY_DN9606_c0_g1_i2.p1 TRINITY_DN9606_c0_g1~~TRINITY_DN9606_c0_g1_i2.p1  ORF type:complete len:252 (+),score=40.74 TRINITY_DN9606_c0_g1_i2:49-804(+)